MPSGLADAAAGAGVSISAAARFTGEFAISTSNTALSTVSLTPWDGFDFEVISNGLGVSVGKLYVVGEIDDSKSDNPSTWLAVSSGTTIYINAKNVYDKINVNTLDLKCDYTDPGNHRHNFNIGCSVQNQGWYVNAAAAYATANSKGHFYILSTHQCSGGGIGDSGDQSDWLKGIYTDAWDDASKSVETPPTSSPGTSFVVKVPKEGKGDATGSKVTSLTFTMTQFDNSSTLNKNVMYVKYDGSVVGQFQHNQYNNGWDAAYSYVDYPTSEGSSNNIYIKWPNDSDHRDNYLGRYYYITSDDNTAYIRYSSASGTKVAKVDHNKYNSGYEQGWKDCYDTIYCYTEAISVDTTNKKVSCKGYARAKKYGESGYTDVDTDTSSKTYSLSANVSLEGKAEVITSWSATSKKASSYTDPDGNVHDFSTARQLYYDCGFGNRYTGATATASISWS